MNRYLQIARKFVPTFERKELDDRPRPDDIENGDGPENNGVLSLNPSLSYRADEKKPYMKEAGDLIIPFASPAKFHYWKEGSQSLRQTLAESNVPFSPDDPETLQG